MYKISMQNRDFVGIESAATRVHYALMMPRYEINRQNTKGKMSTAFFSAIFEIKDVQDPWVSGNRLCA